MGVQIGGPICKLLILGKRSSQNIFFYDFMYLPFLHPIFKIAYLDCDMLFSVTY